MEMDSLVERITREVLAALQDKAPQGGEPARSSSRGGLDLVVFGGDTQELRCFLDDARSMGVTAERTVLALPRDSRVRRSDAEALRVSRVLYQDEAQNPVDLVSEAARVIVPIYRYNQLSNLAGLCDSCWDVRVVLKALAEGREVLVYTAPLDTASPFASKVDSYVQEIRGYGVQVVARGSMAPSAPGKGGGDLGPPPRGSTFSPQPGGQSAPSHSHDSNSPCQLKAVGECAGLGQCTTHLPDRVGIIVEHGADRVSVAPGAGPVGAGMAAAIDHTLLKPDATREEILKLCEEAREYSFASVCINPGFVRLAADALRGSTVKVCTVVGFPLGATTTVTKAMETRDAVANGADEIDMVINVGALKTHSDEVVRRDMEAVVEAADGRIVKVILETALLTDEEKVRACKLAREAGVDFVKTSTGFGPGGATAHDVALMRQTVGKYIGVKASGGIRDLAIAQEMIQAGATRIGASASVKIVKGEAATGPKQAY